MERQPTPEPRRRPWRRRIARAIPAALIAAVLVSGVGWATWTALVPVANNDNSITAETLATPGSVNAVANGGSPTCATGIDVSWSAVPGATTYRVERQSAYGAPDLRSASTGPVTSWTDPAGGHLNFSWTYLITARVGTNWVSAGIGTDPSPLSCGIGEATNLTATKSVVNCKSTALAWTAAGGTVTGYDIERNVNNGGWVAAGSTTAPTVTLTDSVAHGAHASVLYRVFAKNGGTVSTNPSNQASITEWGCVIPPTNPQLTATCATDNRTLTWTGAPTPVDGYRPQYRLDGGIWTNIADQTGTSYNDTVARAAGTRVEYQLLSRNNNGGTLYGTTPSSTVGVTSGFVVESVDFINAPAGTLGVMDANDQIIVTFSRPVAAGTVVQSYVRAVSTNPGRRGIWLSITNAGGNPALTNLDIAQLVTSSNGLVGDGIANGNGVFNTDRTVWTWTSSQSVPAMTQTAAWSTGATLVEGTRAATRATCATPSTFLQPVVPDTINGRW